MGTDGRPLDAIERYCDRVPRSSADALDLGPFTIFRSRIPWRFYARPRQGLDLAVTVEDVAAVRERQRAEGVPERFEWIAEVTPSLAGAAEAAGLNVIRVPLMALEAAAWRPAPAPEGVQVRLLSADDPQLGRANATVELAFVQPHGAPHSELAGPGERDALAARSGDVDFMRDRIARGLTMIAAVEDAAGPLAAGSAQPVGDVTEITGVGTLPSARGRGLATAVTSRLVVDARERGAGIVFLSAADATVAAIYGRLGFREVGTACFGRLPGDGP